MPRLLERAGAKKGSGSITGIYTVLVEGNDMDDPIADNVRSIVDGHIVMERAIADRGRYPAINILKSVSRSLPAAFNEEQKAIFRKSKQLISSYENMAELIKLGAYRKGSDPMVDEAIMLYGAIEEFLTQNKGDHSTIDESFSRLSEILGMDYHNLS
jgi:flagellum-specific ATP synthase